MARTRTDSALGQIRTLFRLGRVGDRADGDVLQDTPLESRFIAITDKRGGFRFPAVPAPRGVVLHVSAEGLAEFGTEVSGNHEAGFISGSLAAPARLTMEPEARVSGKLVTQLPGVCVAGLKVGLQSTNDSTMFWRDTRSDAHGRFEMRGLTGESAESRNWSWTRKSDVAR